MQLPRIPLFIFILAPVIFLYLILCTNIRHKLIDSHISNSVVFVGVVVGFILLYAMQKYEKVDENSLLVSRHLEYLALVALKYDPSLISYLIQYSEEFISNENSYAILCFEKAIVPQIKSDVERKRVRHIVSILDDIFDQRVSKTNTIPELIWYIVFIISVILTVLFPLDSKFDSRIDELLVVILLWLPIVVIYYLYLSEIAQIENVINCSTKLLKKMYKHPDKYNNVNQYCKCIIK